MYIVDANVFAKIFVAEEDSQRAINFFKHAIKNDILLSAPSLFVYEVVQIALYYHFPIEEVLKEIEKHKKVNFALLELNTATWKKVENIVSTGHEKSGFPAVYDSAYHALAIQKNWTFVTADKKHYSKTKQLGNIILLEQWKK